MFIVSSCCFFSTNAVWRDGIAYETPHAFTPVHLAVNAPASLRLLLNQYKIVLLYGCDLLPFLF